MVNLSFSLQAWRDEDMELGCYAKSKNQARDFVGMVDNAGGKQQSRIEVVKTALREETRRLSKLSST